MSEATDRLSPKELQALQGVCNDMEHAEIAEVMRTSKYTVRQYLCRAYAKLGANSAARACYILGNESHPQKD